MHYQASAASRQRTISQTQKLKTLLYLCRGEGDGSLISSVCISHWICCMCRWLWYVRGNCCGSYPKDCSPTLAGGNEWVSGVCMLTNVFEIWVCGRGVYIRVSVSRYLFIHGSWENTVETLHLVGGIVCVVKGNIREFVWEVVKVRVCVCVCVWVL